MIPVEGNPDLYRDEKSNAILNCSVKKYEEYLSIKTTKLIEKNEIEKMKSEIGEIKSLLKILVDKINI
jgi:hypothetical protein